MFRIVLASLLAATVSNAWSQSFVDGSDKQLKPDDVKAVINAFQVINDPLSAQLRDVKVRGDKKYCGSVNAKNLHGGYVGFALFGIDLNAGKFFIVPKVVDERSNEELLKALAIRNYINVICNDK